MLRAKGPGWLGVIALLLGLSMNVHAGTGHSGDAGHGHAHPRALGVNADHRAERHAAGLPASEHTRLPAHGTDHGIECCHTTACPADAPVYVPPALTLATAAGRSPPCADEGPAVGLLHPPLLRPPR